MAEEKHIDEEEAIIPEEDFREAIAACCLDPLLERYFRLAPPGAKLFIGLGFYSTHFGDKVDPAQYAECQAEIEPALTINDLKYLIRFEDDKNTKKYLRGLLAQREAAEEAAVAAASHTADFDAERRNLGGDNGEGHKAAAEPSAAQGSDYIPPVPKRRRRRRSGRALQWMLRKESGRLLPFIGKAAALVAALLGGALFVYMNRGRLGGTPSGAPATNEVVAVAAVEGQVGGDPKEAKADTNAVAVADVVLPSADTNEAIMAAVSSADEAAKVAQGPQSPDEGAQRETNAVAAAASDAPDVAEGKAAGADVETVRKKRKPRRPKVVFTDGRKIVRYKDGRVEVPRVFSCAGAGVKAFWVYGPNPEKDAAKERKARLEWKMLCKKAEAESVECQSE